MKLVTVADVRELIERRLPHRLRAKRTWRYLAAKLNKAAQGRAYTVYAALVIVLTMEGLMCRPQ